MTRFRLNLEDFYPGGPLITLDKLDSGGTFLEKGAEREWLTLNCLASYYGRGYERGDIEYFCAAAEWLEHIIPGAEVWYGHDCDDENIMPFDVVARNNLLEYFHEKQGINDYRKY